jgi:hypothetical protein
VSRERREGDARADGVGAGRQASTGHHLDALHTVRTSVARTSVATLAHLVRGVPAGGERPPLRPACHLRCGRLPTVLGIRRPGICPFLPWTASSDLRPRVASRIAQDNCRANRRVAIRLTRAPRSGSASAGRLRCARPAARGVNAVTCRLTDWTIPCTCGVPAERLIGQTVSSGKLRNVAGIRGVASPTFPQRADDACQRARPAAGHPPTGRKSDDRNPGRMRPE